MSTPPFSFSHMGMFVADIARMRDFYTRVLGFTVTDEGDMETPRGRMRFLFLTRNPAEHHQIVMATGKPRELPFNTINQISFRMADFAGLRTMYRRVRSGALPARGRPSLPAVHRHGARLHGDRLAARTRHPLGARRRDRAHLL